MPSPAEVLRDPNFQQLPQGERLKVMRALDSNFAGLPEPEQMKVIGGAGDGAAAQPYKQDPADPIPGFEFDRKYLGEKAKAMEGIVTGIGNVAKMVRHPIDTLNSIGNTITDPIGATTSTIVSLHDKYQRIKNGEIPQVGGELFGEGLAMKGLSAGVEAVPRMASAVKDLPAKALLEMKKPGTGQIAVGAVEVGSGAAGAAKALLHGNPEGVAVGAAVAKHGYDNVVGGFAKRRAASVDRMAAMKAAAEAPVTPIAPVTAEPAVTAAPGVPDPVNVGVIRKSGAAREVIPAAPENLQESIFSPQAVAERQQIQAAKQTDAYRAGVDAMIERRISRRIPEVGTHAPGPEFTAAEQSAIAGIWKRKLSRLSPEQKGWLAQFTEATKPGPQAVPAAAAPSPTGALASELPQPGPVLVKPNPAIPGEPELVPLEPTPRSEGKLDPGSGQMTLGFSPKSFADASRDAKMMDLADSLYAAQVTPDIAKAMRAKDWKIAADLATAMKVDAYAQAAGVTRDVAAKAVKPVKIPSPDTIDLVVSELGRRNSLLPAEKVTTAVEAIAPKKPAKGHLAKQPASVLRRKK